MNLFRKHRLAFITAGLFLAFGLGCTLLHAAAAPASKPGPVTTGNTNGMIVVCDDGVTYSNSIPLLVFNKNVRVMDRDSDTYMECDRLTLTFVTNVTRQVRTNKTPVLDASGLAGLTGQTNQNTRLNAVYADGRVMIVTKDQQVYGDRAVYYATNDVMVVAGEQVIIADPSFVFLCTGAYYDRAVDVFRSVGPSVVESLNSGGTNKNSFLPGTLKTPKITNAPPGNTNTPAAQPAKK